MRKRSTAARQPASAPNSHHANPFTDQSWTQNPWHHARIRYEDQVLDLLIQTGDEKVARREAKEVCESLSARAKLIEVTRLVIQ